MCEKEKYDKKERSFTEILVYIFSFVLFMSTSGIGSERSIDHKGSNIYYKN